MRKKIVSTICLIMCIGLLFACGGSNDPVKNPKFKATTESDPPSINRYNKPDDFPSIAVEKLNEGFATIKSRQMGDPDLTYEDIVELFGTEGALCVDAPLWDIYQREEEMAVFAWWSESGYNSIYIQFNYSTENKHW